MNREDFSELVAQDVRGLAKESDAIWLRNEDNIEDWHEELINLVRKIDGQLSSNKLEVARKRLELFDKPEEEYLKFEAERQEWRVRTLRFKRATEMRISECKRLLMQLDEDDDIIRLTTAIEKHRERAAEEGASPEDYDQELWNSIGNV